MKKQTRTSFWGIKARDKVMPNKLFADTDRDGVPNVFDCRPFNKRRQDFEPEEEITPSGEKVYVVKSKHGNWQSTDRRKMVDKLHELKFKHPED